MAIIIENNYVGDGSTVLYSFTFEYIEPTDVEVSFDSVKVTTWSFANATEVQLDAAPAAGTAIRIYRRTKVEDPKAVFYPGSAIRSQDLNDNFEQILFVTQEADAISIRAEAAANTAEVAATAAEAAAATAVAAGNSALQIANDSAAVSAAAQATANNAATDAATALSTANTASTNAASAVTDAGNAVSTSNTALSAAVDAATDAAAAVSTANTALSGASSAVTTANNALSTASTANTTANTANTNATTAVNTANTANTNANSAVTVANNAAAAVANALLFDIVPNVASIPTSPADGDAVEVTNATGIESFTPLVGLPAGLVGDAGLTVNLRYTTAGSTWNFLKYFPNDPDDRYVTPTGKIQIDADIATAQATANAALPKAGGTLTGVVNFAATQTKATTSQYGLTQLSSSTSSTSTTLAATPSAVKAAYDLAASKTSNTGTVTSVATSGALTGGTITTSGTLSVRSGTTSQTGVVQLSTATNSTSTTLAATASAAKAAYDRGSTGVTNAATAQTAATSASSAASAAQTTANNALPKAGGTMTGRILFTERAITGSSWNLSQGDYFSAGGISIPNPTSASTGQCGVIRITSAISGWGSYLKFPGGTPPAIGAFPAVIPFYVQSASVILMGNVTEGIV